jgi:hypothetical protein
VKEIGLDDGMMCDEGIVEELIDTNGVDDSLSGVEVGTTTGIDWIGDEDATALDETI